MDSKYGFKQAPQAWYCRIDGNFINLQFMRNKSELTLYVTTEGMDIYQLEEIHLSTIEEVQDRQFQVSRYFSRDK